jgi:hypothetical protein
MVGPYSPKGILEGISKIKQNEQTQLNLNYRNVLPALLLLQGE